MESPEYIQTLVQVATLYYNENETQQEIAKKLGTTRQTVAKFLADAQNKGIVEIKINNPLSDLNDLSQKLVNSFQIKNAIVVPCDFTDESITRDIIAKSASDYLNSLIKNGFKKIGISWGRYVHSLVRNYVALPNSSGLEIIPLLGACSNTAPHFMINEMVRVISEKLDCSPSFIYLPVSTHSKEDYELFTKTGVFKDICDAWENIDLAIVGIGSLPNLDDKSKQTYPGEHEINKALLSTDVVGDVCTHYFDIHGNIISSNKQTNLIRIPEESLRRVRRVFALASGQKKAAAIIGALRSGLISDIILDKKTAEAVLKRI